MNIAFFCDIRDPYMSKTCSNTEYSKPIIGGYYFHSGECRLVVVKINGKEYKQCKKSFRYFCTCGVAVGSMFSKCPAAKDDDHPE